MVNYRWLPLLGNKLQSLGNYRWLPLLGNKLQSLCYVSFGFVDKSILDTILYWWNITMKLIALFMQYMVILVVCNIVT